MANSYIPFDLKIKNILGDTAIITWDVSNVIEFKAGTKYRVYTSPDGAVYTLNQTVSRTEAAVHLSNDNAYVRIASHTPTLGESNQSAPIIITDPLTLAKYVDPTPVAVDADGKTRVLQLGDGSKLEVRAELTDNILVNMSGQAQDQVDLLTEIAAHLAPGAAKESKQDDIILRLVETGDLLTEIRNNTQIGNLRVEETALTAVGLSGMKITLPFWERANIRQTTVLHESGDAVSFVVKIWRRKISSTERDVLARFESYEEDRLDVIKAIPYINLDSLEEITLEIIPNVGTNNNFYVRIAGSLTY